ncbi:hypothetical protein YB2330_004872 [Saitoella coloradoensis]
MPSHGSSISSQQAPQLPMLRSKPSLSHFLAPSRPSTSQRPQAQHTSSDASAHHERTLIRVPSRASSLHSRIAQPVHHPIPSSVRMNAASGSPSRTLCHAYGVFGLPKEPSSWQKSPLTTTDKKIPHLKGAINCYWSPEVLGSLPRVEQDSDIARSLYAAMRASFPHDVEIVVGPKQPVCTSHMFVIQQDAESTLYGTSLRIWSRADNSRARVDTLEEVRQRVGSSAGGDEEAGAADVFWVPYSLCFLSKYPIFSLLTDYLKAMFIHWSRTTNLFSAEEVSRILSFAAPRLNDVLRIDMKDYSLVYQFPSSPSGFQNFPMWPLFSCLSIPNIAGIFEAALSPNGRIIFVSQHTGMLTIASETIRFLCRVYQWSGLYIPVCHASIIASVVNEGGPYMLGLTSESRSLIQAPSDAYVVDLDRNLVQTQAGPAHIFSPRQKQKLIDRLTAALVGEVSITGVPEFLREAFLGGRLTPMGQVLVLRGKEVETVRDPEWFDQAALMNVVDHFCLKPGKRTGLAAVFAGSNAQPKASTTKISVRELNELHRERNAYVREVSDVWTHHVHVKGRLETEVNKVTKRNEKLTTDLDAMKKQFETFEKLAQGLAHDAVEMKTKIEQHKRENSRLMEHLARHKQDAGMMQARLIGTEKERDEAWAKVSAIEHEREMIRSELCFMIEKTQTIAKQRNDAQKVCIHLRSLIDQQSLEVDKIMSGMGDGASQITDQDIAARAEEKEDEENHDIRRDSGVVRSPTPAAPTMYIRPRLKSTPMEKRGSVSSIMDIADKELAAKTTAIADLIQNIKNQCEVAVHSLHFEDSDAPGVEDDGRRTPTDTNRGGRTGVTTPSLYRSTDYSPSRLSQHNRQHSDSVESSDTFPDLGLPAEAMAYHPGSPAYQAHGHKGQVTHNIDDAMTQEIA